MDKMTATYVKVAATLAVLLAPFSPERQLARRRDEHGASSVEYAIITAVTAGIAVGIVMLVRTYANNWIQKLPGF